MSNRSTFFSTSLAIMAVVVTFARQESSTDAAEQAPSAPLGRVLDNSLRMEDRIAAWYEITAMPDASTRLPLAREVATRCDDAIAVYAVPQMIWDGGIPSKVVAARVQKWNPSEQRGVLGAILCAGWFQNTHELALTARMLLEQSATIDPKVVSVAAVIVGHARNMDDIPLLEAAAKARPHVSGTWLGLSEATGGKVDVELQALAARVYRQQELDLSARVAAANMLAGSDAEAAAFVSESVSRFLDKYSDIVMEGIVNEALSGNAEATNQFLEFESQSQVLAVTRVSDETVARTLLERHYNAKNITIRQIANLAAVMRWPRKWLETQGKVGIGESERLNLLALVVLVEPELRSDIEERQDREASDPRVEVVKRAGILCTFPYSDALFGLK